MRVDVIANLNDFNQLRGDWDAIYAADPEAQFFLSWRWLADWLEVWKSPWFVLAARQDEPGAKYVGFLPMRNRLGFDSKRGFYNEIAMMGLQYSDYNGMLLLPETEKEAAKAFGDYIRRQLHWASFPLDNLLISDRRRKAFLSAFDGPKFTQEKVSDVSSEGVDNSIYPYAELPADWDGYLETLSANNRQKIRRLLRKIDAGGECRIALSAPGEMHRDLSAMLDLWRKKWRVSKGDEAEKIATRNYDMLSRCADNGTLMLPVFWRGDEVVAANAILVDPAKKSLMFLIGGRDESFDELPAGYLLHAYALRHAVASGFKKYEFLKGNEGYKYLFAKSERRLNVVTIATKTGRNLGDRIDPSWLPTMLETTLGSEKAGAAADAERAYRQMLEIDPDNALALFRFGRFLAGRGAHAEARRMLARSVEIEPEGDNAWLWLARSLEALGEIGPALAACRRLLALQPEHEEAKALALRLGGTPKAAAPTPALQPLIAAKGPLAGGPVPFDPEAFLRQLAVPDPTARRRG